MHQADVVHLQWLAVPQIDREILPTRPLVFTAHDLLPREPRPGQLRAHRRLLNQMEAIVVHSEYGRRTLVEGTRVDEAKVHVIRHGAFTYLTELPEHPLPDELPDPACRSCSASGCCVPTRASRSCSKRGADAATRSCGSSGGRSESIPPRSPRRRRRACGSSRGSSPTASRRPCSAGPI